MLGTRGEHQQHFAFRCDVELFAVQQDIAHAFAQLGATRLARDHYLMSCALHPLADKSQVGAFAGALAAFQRDE
jgi:hypothetical protein